MSNKRSAKTCRSVRNTRYLHVNVIWQIYWRSSDRFFYFIFIDHLFKDRLTSKFMRDNSTIWFKNYFHELERRNCLYISSLHYALDIIQILQELNTIYNISTSRTWFTGGTCGNKSSSRSQSRRLGEKNWLSKFSNNLWNSPLKLRNNMLGMQKNGAYPPDCHTKRMRRNGRKRNNQRGKRAN